jgi:inorganic pyrophosphatase
MNPPIKRNRTFLSGNLENKTVDVGGWGDVNEAYEIIIVQNVLKIENKPAGLFSIK